MPKATSDTDNDTDIELERIVARLRDSFPDCHIEAGRGPSGYGPIKIEWTDGPSTREVYAAIGDTMVQILTRHVYSDERLKWVEAEIGRRTGITGVSVRYDAFSGLGTWTDDWEYAIALDELFWGGCSLDGWAKSIADDSRIVIPSPTRDDIAHAPLPEF